MSVLEGTHQPAQTASSTAPLEWNYDRIELAADGVVHAVSFVLSIVALLSLATISAIADDRMALSLRLYGVALVAMAVISAAYNLWPVCERKWLLRRIDQSAIFVLAAATYLPFLSKLAPGTSSDLLQIGVCTTAAVGIGLKLGCPGRFDRLSIVMCLLLGWSALLLRLLPSEIGDRSLMLLVAGGIAISVGVVFHLRQTLRFQMAIWHIFVLAGACCHYAAVVSLTGAD